MSKKYYRRTKKSGIEVHKSKDVEKYAAQFALYSYEQITGLIRKLGVRKTELEARRKDNFSLFQDHNKKHGNLQEREERKFFEKYAKLDQVEDSLVDSFMSYFSNSAKERVEKTKDQKKEIDDEIDRKSSLLENPHPRGLTRAQNEEYTDICCQLRALHKVKGKVREKERSAKLNAYESKARQGSNTLKKQLETQLDVLDKCPYCSSRITLENCELDHIHPISKGGQTTPNNSVLVCKACNRKKRAMTVRQFSLSLGLDFEEIAKCLEKLGKDI